MSAQLLNLDSFRAVPTPQPPAEISPVRELPDWKRQQAADRMAMIRPALDRIAGGSSVRSAVQWLLAQQGANLLPSAPTLTRYIDAARKGDLAELAPRYQGRVRKERGWESRAQFLYAKPQHRAYSTVAIMLRKEGWTDATESRVARYLKSLPSNMTITAPGRLGAHYYRQNIKPHVVRDSSVLPVGFIYQGDGHTCDVYVAHPSTGKPYRPELTVWLDVRSHYPVAWWLSESESAQTTLFSLSKCLVDHNHVPAMLHTDPGSGFVNKLIADQVAGWLGRFDIETITALPGNARGKGLVEGFFRWFEERCGKTFDTFCGHVRTDDALRRLESNIGKGKIYLPSFNQYAKAVGDYMEQYRHTPQPTLGALAPAELWRQLERVELVTPAEAIARPREICTVTRWGVQLHKRLYRAAELAQYETRDVLVEYDVTDDRRVWILDAEGRWICDALLVEKKPWLPASRIEEAQQRRLEGQRKRLQRHLAEAEARTRKPIETAALVEQLSAPVDVAAIQEQVAEQIREASSPIDTPQQRFALWQSYDARRESLDEFDRMWLRSYEGSDEFAGMKLVHDDLGQSPTNRE